MTAPGIFFKIRMAHSNSSHLESVFPALRHNSTSNTSTVMPCRAVRQSNHDAASERFTRVEDSSLEEKLTFLAEQRERELDRCEAFARQVEEAMEREISATVTFGRSHGDNQSASSPAVQYLASPYHSDVSWHVSHPSLNQSCPSTPSPFHGRHSEMPTQLVEGCHIRHMSADGFPDLHDGQQRKAAVRLTHSLAGCDCHRQSVLSTPASPAWLADLSFYESVSPRQRHNTSRRTRGTSGRTVQSRTWRTATHEEERQKQPCSKRVASIGCHPTGERRGEQSHSMVLFNNQVLASRGL